MTAERETTTRAHHEVHGQVKWDEPKGDGDIVDVTFTYRGEERTVGYILCYIEPPGTWVLRKP